MSLTDEIQKLYKMKQENILSDDEYSAAKEKLLRDKEIKKQPASRIKNSDENIWAMLIHLSQFFSYVIPFAGLIAPIFLWQIRKKESVYIDRQGRIVANWIFTYFIYLIIFILLSFLIIGIPLLIILAVLGVIFPIIGAIKANDGILWVYPFSIRFFDIDSGE